MFKPVYTRQFAWDVKKAQKRGKNLDKFKIIATTLLSGETLDEIHREHKLLGNYSGRKECHIESDWLLPRSRWWLHHGPGSGRYASSGA